MKSKKLFQIILKQLFLYVILLVCVISLCSRLFTFAIYF